MRLFRLSRISGALAIAALTAIVACRSSYSGYSDSGYSGSSMGVAARSEPVEMPAPAPALAPAPAPRPVVEVTPPPQDAESASRPAELEAFATPEAAMNAVAVAAEAGDHDRMKTLFGHDCGDVVGSDDAPADGDDCVRVARMIREQVTFENGGERTIAVIGKDQWRFPVPLEKGERGWQFDVDGGRDELDTREIGRHEILTVDTLEEIAEAQREFAAESRAGQPQGYAQNFASKQGARDGLYWHAAEGEKTSPIGPLVAAASIDSPSSDGAEPKPFNGYLFKMLHGRHGAGPSKTEGAESRPQGCGALAFPAEYGVTGVMTFMVDQSGIVFEKDLGPETRALVGAITAYAPDSTWKPTKR
jgi:Protein of unknown function (DUF2950)